MSGFETKQFQKAN